MATLSHFDPPARWDDFKGNAHRDAFLALWSANVNEMTEYSIKGDPRAPALDKPRDWYYNPLTTDMSAAVSPPAVIRWTAFPNRLILEYPNASKKQLFRYADDGPPDPNYPPGGSRGWQDEYCELSVTRNQANKITKIDFTCENSQYWEAMWMIDESVVLARYRELVGPQVRLEDLYMRDSKGFVENDPDTKKPKYNPTNKWNRDTKNGAVHLVSPPNNLFAEIYLAAAATILRVHDGQPVLDKDQLILCSQYGTPDRNSDPTIGADVNAVIRGGGVKVSLENPVGLYLQMPSFGSYQLPSQAPSGAKPEDYWSIVRGYSRENPNEPDRILHAVYEVPEDQGFTVGDIKIGNSEIDFASQMMETFQVALAGVAVKTNEPAQTPRECLPSRRRAAAASNLAQVDVDPSHLKALGAFGDGSALGRG